VNTDRPSKAIDGKKLIEWRRAVLERDNHQCVNCTRKLNVAASFIIPPEVGGKLVVSNGATICRNCSVAADSARTLPHKINDKTAVNFYISRQLYDRVNEFAKSTKFGNISALIRHMVDRFLIEPERFSGLENWQDNGTGVKINSWIDGGQYNRFKAQCTLMNQTFTNVFKGLLYVALESTEIDSQTLS
jgi:hypothetical protein